MGAADLRRLEKDAGAMPLSLRAFYEIVGTANFHDKLAEIMPDYRLTLPSPGMDTVLERHPDGLLFVDYLRLVLQDGPIPF